MTEIAKSILFYNDYIDEQGNHVETKEQARVIYAIRFDADKKAVTMNYPLMYLNSASTDDPNCKGIDVAIKNLTFAEEHYPVVQDYVQQNKLKPSQLLYDCYIHNRINVDFNMVIL